MNSRTLLIAGMAATALLIFAGCQAGEETGTSSSQTNTTVKVSPQSAVTPQSAEQNETQEQNKYPDQTQQHAYSQTDIVAFQSALQLKDTKYCDKISDNNFLQQCKMTVTDQIALTAARDTRDPSQCLKLSTKDLQEACKVGVEALKQQYDEGQGNYTQAMATTKSELDLENQIVEAHAYDRCKELTNTSNVHDCQASIATYQAITTKDIGWCDKAPQDAVELCKSSYKSAIGS